MVQQQSSVVKKDGSLRFCVDYCKLNEVSELDAYPMPQLSKLQDIWLMCFNLVLSIYMQYLLGGSSLELAVAAGVSQVGQHPMHKQWNVCDKLKSLQAYNLSVGAPVN